jgi:tRNA threonylcarbamoyl adenosine modification protein (Sua5/YciO/YrdC/YwlC family)
MNKTEILAIKKLKKDGSIDSSIIDAAARSLINNNVVLLPVDGIYGIVSVHEEKIRSAVEHLIGMKDNSVIRMISSFKMLDELASVSKMEYDFLHRIWPGEPIVIMKDISGGARIIQIRMPRGKYKQEIIELVGKPLYYASLLDREKKPVFRKKDLIDMLDGRIDTLLIIDEFCKEHGMPTIVDISQGSLMILNEGRISAEEIKSLYFLGKDDSAV